MKGDLFLAIKENHFCVLKSMQVFTWRKSDFKLKYEHLEDIICFMWIN